mmetsp:Transcript_59648/g.69708  ORF Transcript_59648/g.69708 Transcript_59648/m.69708 type:complete len:164 (+) Transcript_59648:31-522(+)
MNSLTASQSISPNWKMGNQDQQPRLAMMLLVCSTHSPEELENQINYLVDMGFHEKSTILRALVLTNGDLNRAVEFLLDGSIRLPQPINGNSPIDLELKQDGYQLQPIQQSHGYNQQLQSEQYLSGDIMEHRPKQIPTHNVQIKQEECIWIKQEEDANGAISAN